MASPKAKALESIPLFSGLNGRDREFLAGNLDEVSFAPGTTLITEGDSNHTLFVLVDGEADVSVAGQPVRTMQRGDFFGEISMEQRRNATATIVARTPVEAFVMSHAQFRALGGSPQVLARVQQAIHERLAADLRRSDSPA
jgi:CRP-like cAMP-binding protein